MRKSKRNTAIANEMKGTCKVARSLFPEVEIEEIEEIMLNANYEMCPGCWWTSCSELAANDEEYNQCLCDGCVDKSEGEV